jgi:hypothetical protein
MRFESAIKNYEAQPLTLQILLALLKDYKRPFDKIAELVKQQVLIQVKRGFFVLGPASQMEKPEPFLVANHLLGPSYVSLETALSYHKLIPEQVFEISSVTTMRSKIFDTTIGRFSYMHLPLPYYSFGQQSVQLAQDQVVLMATAEKAICDKMITTSGLLFRSSSSVLQWLTEDMRMEKSMLRLLHIDVINSWLSASPKKSSLQLLVKTLEGI